LEILLHLKKRFSWAERITSYARSHTIARIKDRDLKKFKDAGLNRIHIGLESGSDRVLKMAQKGVTKDTHIKAGLKVKKAGMELSEYIMPGLGGKAYSGIHARETADALNRINPDFIRLRTLAIPNSVELYDDYAAGNFEKCTDLMMAKEILIFLESLNGITSVVKSDHILNLFQNLEGKLPRDKARMLDIVHRFLAMDPERQCVYQVGRRFGFFSRLRDMESPRRLAKAEKACRQFGITPENVDEVIDELMKRFI
ncbi:MAG: radical SAM protein, partial [Deltaproteobacteria bacterium]|nr:radical SAM protein [Deltaproteobacteria bacterium]